MTAVDHAVDVVESLVSAILGKSKADEEEVECQELR
jgi:hypothetical protein